MIYLDTSFIIPFYLPESNSHEVEDYFINAPVGKLAISNWVCTEFTSALVKKVRMKELTEQHLKVVYKQFKFDLKTAYHLIIPKSDDYELAEHFLLKSKANLRAGDALHIAIAKNNNVEKLISFDKELIKSAGQFHLVAGTK